ncbi:MAG TPA: SCO family protein [Vicinamibacteria bacterium]|nr:SCO family protein [Vicinamibacteria bacterium]
MPPAAPYQGPAPGRPGRVLAVVGAALVGAGLLAGLVAARTRGTPEPPRMGTLPDFHLVERSGRALSGRDLRGHPWIADFIFTQCGGACPAMTARLARLRPEVPSDVAFVSFTVDPAHDTPEVLARYASAFHADQSWLFATGAQKDLYDLSTQGFKLAAMELAPGDRSGGDGPFLHSSKLSLVDADGVIRGYYDSTDEAALRALVADAAAVRARR